MNNIDSIVKNLPDKPGVYQYYDEHGNIIYVGKAKNLKKRVSSYFNKELLTGKLIMLVRKIADIRYIVVETEFDALLLENTLIKKYQPRYNVLLKDDKTFPWICIKNEPFPRIFPTRHIARDGSEYFGPYASVTMMNTLLELIHSLYPLRNCTLNLTEENIRKKKFKVCLEYHIGNCKGPCEALQSKDDYDNNITEIKQIIKGNINVVAQGLKALMKKYSDELEFEKANIVKEKIGILSKYQSKSIVVNTAIDNVDVFSIITDDESGYVNYLKIIKGAIIRSHTIELKKKLDETPGELLSIAIADFRQRFESDAREIILPFIIEEAIPNVNYTVPKKGDKKSLLELSQRNAKYYQMDKQKQKELIDPERHSKRILNTMMKDLRLKELPAYIDCFDNSNFQGGFPVAAMVVFRDAKPSKKDYRHFNIKTVEGPDDFASMEEIIFRRYKRLLEEKSPLPQLIVIDGGKGQLSSAINSLEKLGLRGKINIIGIAKKLEEIFYPGDTIPMYLDKKSETLRVLQHIRDEAHRFGITFHRNKRSKGTIRTELSDIKGIGESTANNLLLHFKSVENIKIANLSELENVVGKAKAKIVFDYFHKT
jgi:excinuclease ABC subunit C